MADNGAQRKTRLRLCIRYFRVLEDRRGSRETTVRRTPHPPLRTSRQWRARGEHRQGPCATRRLARGGGRWRRNCTECRAGQPPHPAAAMPMLRRAHDRHRSLCPRRHAQIPAARRSASLGRHIMMPLLPFPNRNAGRDRCWAWTGHAGARHKRLPSSSKSPLCTPAGGFSAAVARPLRLHKRPRHPFVPRSWELAGTGVLFKSP
jgi:hypothetical protein